MYRVAFLTVFLLITTSALGDTGSNMCLLLEAKRKNIDQRVTELKKKYPDSTKFYGLNSFMLRAEMEDAGAYFMIKIAESVSKCTKKLDGKQCNLAAGEIIKLIKYGIDMCKAANKNNCNIC